MTPGPIETGDALAHTPAAPDPAPAALTPAPASAAAPAALTPAPASAAAPAQPSTETRGTTDPIGTVVMVLRSGLMFRQNERHNPSERLYYSNQLVHNCLNF